MRLSRMFSVVLTCVAGLLVAAPHASANDPCVGTENTIAVCVRPAGLPGVTTEPYVDCVYVVVRDCVPVEVPLPVVEPDDGGAVIYVTGISPGPCIDFLRLCWT